MQSNSIDIGKRLASARKMFGHTQRALAEKAGVNHSTISLIEQNRISPSVGALKRILDGLPMSLSTFFNEEELSPGERFWFPREELTNISSTDAVSLLQVGGNLSGRALQVMHETFQPGADSGPAMLTHEGEEAGFVTRGEIELTVAGERRVLRQGDAYYFRSSLPHRFRNAGEEIAEIISACTPPTF